MDTRNVNGLSHERLYKVYSGMISRCYNKKHPHYNNWGGRGIRVYDEWRYNYQKFRNWAIYSGYDETKSRKEQMLDRINNDGNYCPENCRWTTAREQNLNRRFPGKNCKGYKYNWTFEGVTKSMVEWCSIFNVSVPMIYYRVNEKNMSPFLALITPVKRGDNVNEISNEKVIALKDKGMTNKQISEMLDCSVTTVRRRLGKEC